MTIASEITRIKTAIADAYAACQDMGATMPAVLNSDNLEQCIASISGGQPAGQGRFVAASKNKIAYSDDGINWNEIENTSGYNKIFYGDNKFITTANGSHIFKSSTDGINWTSLNTGYSPGSDGRWILCYGNNKWLGMSDYQNVPQWLYSEDGINWELIHTYGKGYEGIAYGNNIFVGIQSYYNDSSYVYFYDKDNFSSARLPATAPYGWKSIVFGDNKFIIIGAGTTTYCYSTDGINWSTGTLPSSFSNSPKITYGNGKFVIIGWNTSTVLYSTDGINWNTSSLPSSLGWDGLTYGDNKFISVAQASSSPWTTTTYAYSTDGINWTPSTLPSSQPWSSIAYGEVQ